MVELPLPPNAQLMTPPSVYATWWAMTEACSGVTGSLDAIRWYQVPNAETVPYPGMDDVNAYWSSGDHHIVVAGAWVLDGGLVRHEMLHALLQVADHPRAAFLGKCAGVVDCDRDPVCVAGAGRLPPIDPATPTVTPDQLRQSITVSPAVPSIQTDGGFFIVTVSATNTRSHAVIVALPDSNVSNLGIAFAYHLQGPFGGISDDVRPHDSGAVRFAPNETKRQVFDFRVGYDSTSFAPHNFRPGTYSVGGTFGETLPWLDQTVVFQP